MVVTQSSLSLYIYFFFFMHKRARTYSDMRLRDHMEIYLFNSSPSQHLLRPESIPPAASDHNYCDAWQGATAPVSGEVSSSATWTDDGMSSRHHPRENQNDIRSDTLPINSDLGENKKFLQSHVRTKCPSVWSFYQFRIGNSEWFWKRSGKFSKRHVPKRWNLKLHVQKNACYLPLA